MTIPDESESDDSVIAELMGFHNYAATVEDVDAPPGTVNPVASTQSLVV